MALGSYASSRIKHSHTKLIHIYIFLELVIALSALILLPVMANLGSFIESYPYFASSLFGKFITASALMTTLPETVGG